MDNETIVVHLNSGPVEIDPNTWPVVAHADDTSFEGNDYARRHQAEARGEVDAYYVRVRAHRDGRTLVYALVEAATAWTGSHDSWAGLVLASSTFRADIVATIREVCDECLPDSVAGRLANACIAELPPERLD